MPHGQRDAARIQAWADHLITTIENSPHADPERVVA